MTMTDQQDDIVTRLRAPLPFGSFPDRGEAADDIERLKVELRKARGDFLAYGCHTADCSGGDGSRCQCGYHDAWSAATDHEQLAGKRSMEKLSQYQDVVSIDSLSIDEVRTVFCLVLDHLNLDIIRERTPDYTAFELRPRS